MKRPNTPRNLTGRQQCSRLPRCPVSRVPLAPGDTVELRDECEGRHRDGCLCGRTLRIRSLVAAVTAAGVPAQWRVCLDNGRTVLAGAVARRVEEIADLRERVAVLEQTARREGVEDV